MTAITRPLPLLQGLLLTLLCLLAAACQSVAPAPQGLTSAQIEGLRLEGFQDSAEGLEFTASDRLLFGSDEAALTAAARDAVARIGRLLATLDIPRIRVDGHTDNTGSAAHNLSLSQRRADAVAAALIEAGVRGERVHTRGLGSTLPVAANDTAGGRQQNRRVVIVVLSD